MADGIGIPPEEVARLRAFVAEQQAITDAQAKRLGVVIRRDFPKQNGEPPPAMDEPPPIEDVDEDPKHPPRSALDWTALEGKDPPKRQWIEPDWLPDAGCLLAGAAGVGKTLIAQQWASLLALGRGYMNAPAAPLRVLMWAAEDSHDELWRRQVAIAQLLGVPISDFAERLTVMCYEGEEVELVGTVMGRLCASRMLKELREQIGDYQAQYVFLDNVARLYGGEENDRHQVTTFCALVTGAVHKGGGSGYCLLAHPSKAIGSEFSGSTAWEAAVRSRLFLGRTLPDQEAPSPEEAQDDGVRYLARRKSNYSDRDWLKLAYQDGTLVPQERPKRNGQYQARGEFAKDQVLRALRKVIGMGEAPTASSASPSYLVKLAQKFDLLDGLSRREFEKALNALRAEGRITQHQVGTYANRTPRFALTEAEIEPHK